MSERRAIKLTINGRDHRVTVEPRRTLVDVIRDDCGQTGTHIGCEHGVCGTCTVLRDGESIRSCTTFAVQVDGAEIRTVEGLAKGAELHPLQDEFWDKQGLQCGYCTPGMLLTVSALLEAGELDSEEAIKRNLSGNLCRCTGYRGIIEAVADLAGVG